ncbi:translation initiation factor IF-3 [Desulfoplanes sp.]
MQSTNARRNRQIRVREVRVVTDDGTQLGVMPTHQALQTAEERGLDLVEVAPNARPPVCKIMDYGKYQYQQKKQQQLARKKQTTIQLKEIKFRPKTDDHDLETKVRHIRKFITEGNRCKVSIFFRGREMAHKDRGYALLQRVIELVKDIAKVEQTPRSEGRSMHLLLTPLPKSK